MFDLSKQKKISSLTVAIDTLIAKELSSIARIQATIGRHNPSSL